MTQAETMPPGAMPPAGGGEGGGKGKGDAGATPPKGGTQPKGGGKPAPKDGGGDAPKLGYYESPIPDDGMPDVFKPFKGKSLHEIAGAHKELRSTLNDKAARITELEGNLAEMKASLAQSGQSDEDRAAAETRGLWEQSIYHYWEGNGADSDMIDSIVKRTGLGRQEVLDLHEMQLQKRNAFLEKSKADFPDIDLEGLEGWVQAGESGLPNHVIEAFYVLADEGYNGWLDLLNKRYQGWLEAGGGKPSRGKGTARHATHRGRPPTPEGGGFKTREDYQRAYAEARNSGDAAQVDKVLAKLKDSNVAGWDARA